MRIQAVETRLFRIPPAVPWVDAAQPVPRLELVTVVLHTDRGTSGIGYTYTTGVGASAIVSLIDDYCATWLHGRDARPRAVSAGLRAFLHRCGTGINTLSLAAIDIALWDIAAKSLEVPLYEMLGGSGEPVQAYGSGIDLGLSDEALAEEVGQFREDRLVPVKVKVGRNDPRSDVERVRRSKEVLGSDELAVDANQAWLLAEARRREASLASMGLLWMEEPLDASQVEAHGELRRHAVTPIACGESLYSAAEFATYLAHDAIDILQPDVCRVGGITPFLDIVGLAHAAGVPVIPHFLPEITVSVASALADIRLIEWVRGGSLTELGVLQDPLLMEHGQITPWRRPGHGIVFDFDRLDRYAVSAGASEDEETPADANEG